MNDYLIKASSLSAMANAIRAQIGDEDMIQGSAIVDYISNFDQHYLTGLLNNQVRCANFPSITTISNSAFKHCSSLTNINFPMATSIGDQAFAYCTSLGDIEFPLVTSVGNEVFYWSDTGPTSVSFPVLTEMGTGIFSFCRSLTTVNLPEIITLPSRTFYYTDSLANINCPKLQTIENTAFDSSGIQSISLPSVTSCGNSAFTKCYALKSADFPELVSAGQWMFHDCSNLESVNLPKLTSIPSAMFYRCSSLKSLTLPAAQTIQSSAFQYSGLSELTLQSSTMCVLETVTAFDNSPLSTASDGVIYVPGALVDQYKADSKWSTFAEHIFSYDNYVQSMSAQSLLYNSTKSVSLAYSTQDAELSFNVTSGDETVVTTSDVTYGDGVLTFNINTLAKEGCATVKVSLITASGTFECASQVNVYESYPEPIFTIESVDEAAYGFTLNDAGYYESTNKAMQSSAAITKVVVNTYGIYKLYFDCINYAEKNYDFGIISNLDSPLDLTSTVDANIHTSFKGKSQSSVQTVDYGVIPAGEHCIYVKYLKDGSGNNYNDSFQFKIRFELI